MFSEILIKIQTFFIHENVYLNIICEMGAILSRGRWVKVLTLTEGASTNALLGSVLTFSVTKTWDVRLSSFARHGTNWFWRSGSTQITPTYAVQGGPNSKCIHEIVYKRRIMIISGNNLIIPVQKHRKMENLSKVTNNVSRDHFVSNHDSESLNLL